MESLQLLTGPVVFLVSWLLFGVYEIGYSIEDPFQGTLRLSVICETIRRDVLGDELIRNTAFEVVTGEEEAGQKKTAKSDDMVASENSGGENHVKNNFSKDGEETEDEEEALGDLGDYESDTMFVKKGEDKSMTFDVVDSENGRTGDSTETRVSTLLGSSTRINANDMATTKKP